MNDFLEIFSDVVLLATFQPRFRERFSPQLRIDDTSRSRLRTSFASDRRFGVLERV